MPTLSIYIFDDRYSAPTLKLAVCPDDADVAGRAEALLRDSPHHLAVEVFCEDQQLLRVERPETGSQPGASVPQRLEQESGA